MYDPHQWEQAGRMYNCLQQQEPYSPIRFECKNKAKYAVYGDYDQATTHGSCEPLLVIKMNRRKPLAVIDAEHFFFLVRTMHELLVEQRFKEQGHRDE